MFGISDNNKIGIFLIISSVFSYFAAIFLLFDRSLLILANICFVAGIFSLVGFTGLFSFLLNPQKILGTMIFFFGFLVIVLKFAFIGGLIQFYGLYGMFKVFLPSVFQWLITLPGIGRVLSLFKRI